MPDIIFDRVFAETVSIYVDQSSGRSTLKLVQSESLAPAPIAQGPRELERETIVPLALDQCPRGYRLRGIVKVFVDRALILHSFRSDARMLSRCNRHEAIRDSSSWIMQPRRYTELGVLWRNNRQQGQRVWERATARSLNDRMRSSDRAARARNNALGTHFRSKSDSGVRWRGGDHGHP